MMFTVAAVFCGPAARQLRLSLKHRLTRWLGWQVRMGSARNSGLCYNRDVDDGPLSALSACKRGCGLRGPAFQGQSPEAKGWPFQSLASSSQTTLGPDP